MNTLLFAPGFALLYYQGTGFGYSIISAVAVVVIQVLIGLPFLLHNPSSYISKAFEFSRQFFYKWTVNWRMFSEQEFLSVEFSRILLVLHLVLLLLFTVKWCRYLLLTQAIWWGLVSCFKWADSKAAKQYSWSRL